MQHRFDQKLDLTKIAAPLNLLRARSAITAMLPGKSLYIIASGGTAKRDFQAFSKVAECPILEEAEEDMQYHCILSKPSS